VSVDSIPATYFETLMVRFVAGIIETHAPRSARVQRGKGLTALLPHNLLITRRFGHVVHLLNEQPEDFLPSSWTAFIEATLEATWAECEEQLGPPGPKWRWGHLRRVTLTHPFGEKKIGAALFNVPDIPCPGDATTIHQAAVDLMEPYGNPVGLATARMVIDVGEWDSSRFVLLGGQSGNPFSPHYRDQIEMWSRGEGVPIPHTPQAVERAITRRLVLVPMEASPAS
jgi:penicillin amidase